MAWQRRESHDVTIERHHELALEWLQRRSERDGAVRLCSEVVVPDALRLEAHEVEPVEDIWRAVCREEGRRRQHLEVEMRCRREPRVADQADQVSSTDALPDLDGDRAFLQMTIQQISVDAIGLIAESVVRSIDLVLIDFDDDVVADRVGDWRGRRLVRRWLIATPVAGDDDDAIAGRDRWLLVGQVAVEVGWVITDPGSVLVVEPEE